MNHAIEIKNFSKFYGDQSAVSNLSFNIEDGEVFGLLGPNGAGKSSTINSICGISNFQEGEILVYGNSIKKDPIKAKKLIGISPQDYNVDIFLPIYTILMYCGGYYGIPKKERKRRIAEVLKLLNLSQHAHKKFQQLSGGMKRRAMLARALICNPKLLILDEPTAGLDVELRYELWDLIKKLNSQGKTIILTSHYIEEVEQLCERIAIINHGRLLFIGHKSELLKNHTSLEEAFIQAIKNDEH
ncbi:MAG: putative ABC transporter ATP-binding protein YadG [Chlamydiae bacterium]|nr:putative ABC transporter ATP-binding protein YadG [Chlamydiota bacterium]